MRILWIEDDRTDIYGLEAQCEARGWQINIAYNFCDGVKMLAAEENKFDIVVIDLPGQTEMLIKRVVGLPGESVEVRNGQVYIDGEQLDEPWTVRPGGGNYGPQTIPPLRVFVMGDNRGASNDSRSFGPVAIEHVVGHAWFSYWPPEYIGVVE